MTTRKKKTKTRKAQTSERLAAAGRNLRRIQKEIAPYVKRRDAQQVSTAGTWRETSSFIVDISDPKSFGQPPS